MTLLSNIVLEIFGIVDGILPNAILVIINTSVRQSHLCGLYGTQCLCPGVIGREGYQRIPARPVHDS